MIRRGADLLAWLSTHLPEARDSAIESHLGIADGAPYSAPPGEHLIGYHASSVASIVRALAEVPVLSDDVVVDLGAGLGKVAFLTHLLTGATARGIELQPALVAAARAAAASLGIDVRFAQGDAREVALDDGTVFFLYAPFTGPVLAQVLRRLRAVAEHHAIVLCALGVDLDCEGPWLVARRLDSFWLTIYDTVGKGTPPRARRGPSPLGPLADVIGFERV
jgi:SAM-dependent methyltransferase